MIAAGSPTSSSKPAAPALKPVLGVSICVWRGDDVLLIRRGKQPSKGLWAPVGGRVEWGEILKEAARREVLEETAIDCEIVGLSQLREMIEPDAVGAPGYHVVLAVFAARWRSGEVLAGDDAEAADWVHPDRLAALSLVPGVIPYIAATRVLIEGAV